jgi:hypothetical protein
MREYGRSQGGIVNVVTASGGNAFQGQAYAFLTQDELTSRGKVGLNDLALAEFSQYDVVPASAGRLCVIGSGSTVPTIRLSIAGMPPSLDPGHCATTGPLIFVPESSRGRPAPRRV